MERHGLATRVIFILDFTRIGQYACYYAVNLVVVDIPEGVKSIGDDAFFCCSSLTTVSFPTTLTSIGRLAFGWCSSLRTVDLLLTNLQEIGTKTFYYGNELSSMTIPDSLQTLGDSVFYRSSKLVPSNIEVRDKFNDTTSEVVAHLSSKQQS